MESIVEVVSNELQRLLRPILQHEGHAVFQVHVHSIPASSCFSARGLAGEGRTTFLGTLPGKASLSLLSDRVVVPDVDGMSSCIATSSPGLRTCSPSLLSFVAVFIAEREVQRRICLCLCLPVPDSSRLVLFLLPPPSHLHSRSRHPATEIPGLQRQVAQLGIRAVMAREEEEERMMLMAEEEARQALEEGEVPVGCVLTRGGSVIARGHNKTNERMDATRHAEMVAIDALVEESGEGFEAQKLLAGCTLYVTCEPCIMCASALAMLGLEKAVFGCRNDKFGGNGSVMCMHEGGTDLREIGFTSYAVRAGVREQEAVELFKKFYARENSKAPVPKRRKEEGEK
eukprot:756587-Hanusia_phi.AAC.1